MKHPNMTRLRKVWKPHGRSRPTKLKEIRAAMRQAGVAEKSVTYFLYHSSFAKARREVVRLIDSAETAE